MSASELINRRNIGFAMILIGLLVLILSKPDIGTFCLAGSSGGSIDRIVIEWHEIGISSGDCYSYLKPAGFIGIGVLSIVGGSAMAVRNW
ncbi:hypothetical protein SAMN05421858_1631 [Haladaptatus litoreus]|uniref:Uncharacterized protein n=1 Tax=Haladaptatus litoreus TaxID=553468 RepID=A0A1N6YM42_9EURY|nr:hypothetical protein [Haladaptatus litoreus]SIR15616.1 hypothetical protein SAMN05421858_1631 [Haladaptatus litoreus]